MIASYTVASHCVDTESHRDSAQPSSEAKKRIDRLVLALDAWKMPVCDAKRTTINGFLPGVMNEIEQRQSSIRSIVLGDEGDLIGGSAHIRAHYLTAVCPHCGIKEQLEHGRWRVYRAGECKIAHIIDDECDDEPQGASRCYADHPRDWMPFDDGELAPLTDNSEGIEMPYGNRLPVQELKAHLRQPTLSHGGIDVGTSRRVYGRIGGYKGIYSCQHCGKAYYVVYNAPNQDDPVIRPDDLKPYEAQTPFFTCAQINVLIESRANDITIGFSPPLEGHINTIRFELARGYMEVDGLQLMKGDEPVSPSFAHLPLGFACAELLSLVSSLMSERIGDVERALQLVKSARYNTVPGSMYGSGVNVLDLAVVNRLQGYPDALYENIFPKRTCCPEDCVPYIAPFGVLPVNYDEIEKVYGLSGLPQCKSVRRAAFEQPLLITYAQTARTIPFKDPDVLTNLLSGDAALPLFDALSRSRGEISVFEYLLESRGELAVLRYVESLIGKGKRLAFLGCGGRRRVLDEHTRRAIDKLPVDKAGSVLQGILIEDACCEVDLTGEYEYDQQQLELQGSLFSFDFILPPTPLSMILAGAELGNCLSAYASRIEKRSTIVVVRSEGSAIAAVEVDADKSCVVQAKGKYNKQIPRQGALYSAFTTWLHDKRLEYRPIR